MEIKIITCKNTTQCIKSGEMNFCLPDIENTIKNNNIAFMIYSNHVFDQIKNKYLTYVKYQNGIAIGLYMYSPENQEAIKYFNQFK